MVSGEETDAGSWPVVAALRLLLVEDSRSDAELVCELVADDRRGAVDVTVVTTFAAARSRLEEEGFDCVLLDLGLPDAFGLDSVALLAGVVEVPIVVLTGRSDEGLGRAAIRAGAQDYLPKHDLSASVLTRTVRHAIERQYQRLALAKAHADLAREFENRVRAEHELRLSYEHLAAIIENASDIIAVVDGNDTVRSVNPAVGRLLGWTMTDVVGRNAYDLIHPEDIDNARHVLATAFDSPGAPTRVELRAACASGRWRRVELLTGNRLATGPEALFIVTLRDMPALRAVDAVVADEQPALSC